MTGADVFDLCSDQNFPTRHSYGEASEEEFGGFMMREENDVEMRCSRNELLR